MVFYRERFKKIFAREEMTMDDKTKKVPDQRQELSIERLFNFLIKITNLQGLIEEGEYTNITEIVQDSLKKFRLEWRDMESVQSFMPMRRIRGMNMMPMMKRMMVMFKGDRATIEEKLGVIKWD